MVRLCGLGQACGAICTMGLYFFTPHATTCLLFLQLVTTVYSDLLMSSFFLSILIITYSILYCHIPHRHQATHYLLHQTSFGYVPDTLSLSRDRNPDDWGDWDAYDPAVSWRDLSVRVKPKGRDLSGLTETWPEATTTHRNIQSA